MSLAYYYFIPTVREGLAAYLDGEAVGRWATVKARVEPWADGPVEDDEADENVKEIALYGPGEVFGFDTSVIARTDPGPNTWDYEPNFMPLVEFSEPDLPWRFTPAAAIERETSGRLWPWLTLIVLQAEGEEFEGLDERQQADGQKKTMPIRWIRGVKASALPDLENSWMWAHVQVTAESTLAGNPTGISLRDVLAEMISGNGQGPDSHIAARLICPRRLAPRTRYVGFVVPTFKLGVVAAGLTTVGDDDKALTLSWTKGDGGTIDLPYYHKWEFGTGLRGDFESLVRLLQPRELTGLGRRRMDCTSNLYGLPPCPGHDESDEGVLELEGALISPNLDPARWGSESSTVTQDAYQRELANLLNLPTTLLTDGSETPPVVPPGFGRRHSGRPTVDAGDLAGWQNDMNLDPRQRAAAGYGALVIQKEQEPLMAELWDQLGDIDQANELMRRGQLGVEASKGVFKRLQTLDRADFLWITAPVFARVRAQTPTSTRPTTVGHYLEDSSLPNAAFDPAFRRIARRRGGLRKRQRSVPKPQVGQDLLSRLNRGEIAAAGAPPSPLGMPSMCRVTEAAIMALERESAPQRKAQGRFRINGRVVDRRNGRGIEGVRVEAWDKDLIQSDMLGSSITNKRGTFRIEFDTTYFAFFFRKARIDPNPDVVFKVFREKKPIRVVAPGTLRNLRAGDTDVVVEVELPAGPERTLPYRVSGRVVDRTTKDAVPWVRVEAWDKDPLTDDLVGSTVTDGGGEFHIEFEQCYYKEWLFDRRADLYFKVYQGDKLIGTTERAVMSAVKQGDTGNVVVEVEGPVPPLRAPGGPRVHDFCEAAITCESLTEATTSSDWSQLHKDAARAVCAALDDWLGPLEPSLDEPTPADLPAVHDIVKTALAPWVTIPARVWSRIKVGAGAHQNGVLGRIESAVEFPQPMYEPLAAISQDLILPGVETVPQNTLSIVKTNRRFLEAYMLGLNDCMAGEALWRGAPVYLWTTFFRQFWDVRGLLEEDEDPELWMDITRLTTWTSGSELGSHRPGAENMSAPREAAVLLVRGDLLKRFPNTLIYAVESLPNGTPALDEYEPGITEARLWPVFSGTLAPDLTFLGFPRNPEELCVGGSSGKGYFIVLEERLAEPRFGFDLPGGQESPSSAQGNWWYDLTWEDIRRPSQSGSYVEENEYIDEAAPTAPLPLPVWGASSAAIANICLQRPVRVAIHASKMIPKDVSTVD